MRSGCWTIEAAHESASRSHASGNPQSRGPSLTNVIPPPARRCRSHLPQTFQCRSDIVWVSRYTGPQFLFEEELVVKLRPVGGNLGNMRSPPRKIKELWLAELPLVSVPEDVKLGKCSIRVPPRSILRCPVDWQRAMRSLVPVCNEKRDEFIELLGRRRIKGPRSLDLGTVNPHCLALEFQERHQHPVSIRTGALRTSLSLSPRSNTTTPPKILPSAQYPAMSPSPRGYRSLSV